MDLFTLKKIISALVMPMSLIVIFLILAIVFFRAKPNFSFKCLLFSTLLLLLSSIAPVSDRLMLPIENNFESFTRSTKPVDYIVVLGCSHITDHAIPVTSQLHSCSLQRLVEALRILQLHPEAQLITSGAALDDESSNAEKVKQAAIALGVSEDKIIVENFPKDTEEEALLIAPRVKGKTVVLVTNADHMPRAVKYFTQQGIDIIPAPASNWVKAAEQEKSWQYYLPNSHKLSQTTHVWYEYLGQLAQWLKTL